MAANRILIVEDDHGISDAVGLNLRYVGYDCAVFDDGSAAVASLETDHAYVSAPAGPDLRWQGDCNGRPSWRNGEQPLYFGNYSQTASG